MRIRFIFIFATLFCAVSAFSLAASTQGLFRDLEVADYWSQKDKEELPFVYNSYLQGGYLIMPSARMPHEGELAAGASFVPPYRNYSLAFQIANFLEFSGNYRVFSGVEDVVLSGSGFGDYSDKGANVKLMILSPRASNYRLPGIAVGIEDFLGSRLFEARYIVATYVLPQLNLEASLGYGTNRFNGLFGGVAFSPFRQIKNPLIQNISLLAEYDATNYRRDPHPDGRDQRSPLNVGLNYPISTWGNIGISYLRGRHVAIAGNLHCNVGRRNGFFPKFKDPPPYKAPVNHQPLGVIRTSELMAEEFAFALQDQGIQLKEAWMEKSEGKQCLRLVVENQTWFRAHTFRDRVQAIISALTPTGIDEVLVVVRSGRLPVHEYLFRNPYLRLHREGKIGNYELYVLSPRREVTPFDSGAAEQLLRGRSTTINFALVPRMKTWFGSANGKFKYSAGLAAVVSGYLPYNLFYTASVQYSLLTNFDTIKSVDKVNPSQLINVRSDLSDYRQTRLSLESAFLQRDWSVAPGLYTRLAAGYFEVAYGGLAGECLYFPVDANWAVGIEGALLAKREYRGLGFTSRVRRLRGFTPTYERFHPNQFFLNWYYDMTGARLHVHVKAGRFLARDLGVRFQLTRYFESGVEFGAWITVTDGRDYVNGQRYHDLGLFVSVPLDIFYPNSRKARYYYGMSAWLRDVGASASTGRQLYQRLRQERRF